MKTLSSSEKTVDSSPLCSFHYVPRFFLSSKIPVQAVESKMIQYQSEDEKLWVTPCPRATLTQFVHSSQQKQTGAKQHLTTAGHIEPTSNQESHMYDHTVSVLTVCYFEIQRFCNWP